MKRWILRAFALVLIFALAGCSAGEKNAGGRPGTVAPSVTGEDRPTPEQVETTTAPPSAQESREVSSEVPAEEFAHEEPSPSVSAEEEVPVESPAPAQPVEEKKNDSYFDGALFIGDSILEGVRQYVAVQRNERTTLGNAKFLATTSGIGVADLVGDRQSGLYYRYKGEEMPLEKIAAEIAPNRIFLFLGLNDLAAVDPQIDVIIGQYIRLVEHLSTVCPEAEVIIMTNPPKVASTWLPSYTPNRSFGNELIDAFVEALVGMCKEQEIACIDIHAALENEAGVLPEAYCSDGFVHLNSTGAAAVVDALYRYADQMA